MCGGQIVEDIDRYNRLHEMVDIMKPTEKRLNDMIEGFGSNETSSIADDGAEYVHNILKPGETQTVCFTPLSGRLPREKFMPIRYCPIQLEFELVGDASEAVQGAISSIGGRESFLLTMSMLNVVWFNLITAWAMNTPVIYYPEITAIQFLHFYRRFSS